MTRYGYFGMDEDYSDVNDTPVRAVCSECDRRVIVSAEGAELVNGKWVTDDLCSELPDEVKPSDRFARPHEWN